MELEIKKQLRVRNINFEAIFIEVIFQAIREDKISEAKKVEREEQRTEDRTLENTCS